ncbi:GntR family transcriptional regulator [Paracoccus siganidrum]|uniref:GntR family transcriptional regulator n=1 Tax=Paracoccus siganidrum TaxID=1276757 RepID=A0A419A5M9_9RHOB|nr:GntR family transcriptional regulator [Paracoccus siganidrum]RJL12332.1 GntR family transcriptional regulator [Paracoccus siganidrum]RMC29877.1 GntR family transcriptional regulator [Paracoccus siganidrum]
MPFREAEVPNLGQAPTASDIILKFIRDSIADGSLDEGEPIRQDDVARMFNVSKIPVREALKRLEAEGLVEFQRNKGAIVTSVSEPEIAQIFETRAILESNAIRLSVPHMTPETFTDAEAFCDAFARETDVAQWSALNWQFHSRLYLDAQRPFLVRTIRSVNDRLERYLRIQLALSHGQGTADREHRQILAACRAGDAEKAGKLAYDHIMGACSSLLHHLPASKATG